MIGQPVSSFPQLIECANKGCMSEILSQWPMLRVFSSLANGGHHVFLLVVFKQIHLFALYATAGCSGILSFLNWWFPPSSKLTNAVAGSGWNILDVYRRYFSTRRCFTSCFLIAALFRLFWLKSCVVWWRELGVGVCLRSVWKSKRSQQDLFLVF